MCCIYKFPIFFFLFVKNVAKSKSHDGKIETNGDAVDEAFMFDGEDDEDDNAISLNKIKASIRDDDDDDNKSMSDVTSLKKFEVKHVLPEINLQEPFQPGSTPSHLISRYMVNTYIYHSILDVIKKMKNQLLFAFRCGMT